MITTSVMCTIERRLLVNYRIEPAAAALLLPEPFRPQVVSGSAVGGVCFIRLRRVRPRHVPSTFGITTENVAHRLAVEWDDGDGTHVGVYVPRRDTKSRITSLGGGRIFVGRYHRARFDVDEPGDDVRIRMSSVDGQVNLAVHAMHTDTLHSELFESLDQAIAFFRNGALGVSPSAREGCFDAVRLDTSTWSAQAMTVNHMTSSLFDDAMLFPAGSCRVDSAMIMLNIPVRWVTESAPTTNPFRRAA